jgi:hypothetical protein
VFFVKLTKEIDVAKKFLPSIQFTVKAILFSFFFFLLLFLGGVQKEVKRLFTDLELFFSENALFSVSSRRLKSFDSKF